MPRESLDNSQATTRANSCVVTRVCVGVSISIFLIWDSVRFSLVIFESTTPGKTELIRNPVFEKSAITEFTKPSKAAFDTE
jgi:hypothetical protein